MVSYIDYANGDSDTYNKKSGLNNMFSIHTAAYNINSMTFDWRENMTNWINFLNSDDELVVALNTSTDDSFSELSKFFENIMGGGGSYTGYNGPELRILYTNFDYSDPEFDGKIKNAAYKACTKEFCILLDLDEVIPLWNKPAWITLANQFRPTPFDAMLLPSVDLCKGPRNVKNIGQKWYMVKNLPHLKRGVVNFARKDDGSIDTNRSDTCEVISEYGELARSNYVMMPQLPSFIKLNILASNSVPFVYHRGWENKEQRLKTSAFWKPVWENRAKKVIDDMVLTGDAYDDIEVFPHEMKLWNEL